MKGNLKAGLLMVLLFVMACNSDKKDSASDSITNDTVVVDTLIADTNYVTIEVDSNLKICTPLGNIGINSSLALDSSFKSIQGGVIANKRWFTSLGSPRVLKVYFMDGNNIQREKVKTIAREWENPVNFKLVFTNNSSEADIKISFNQVGSWSYLGTDSRGRTPSMNLGWLKSNSPNLEYKRVVLHEFGHALGFPHEHQNPNGNLIKWDRTKVLAYFMGNQKWSKQMVEDNIFKIFEASSWIGTKFDSTSIMIYAIDPKLTTDNYEVKWNNELSTSDISTAKKAYGNNSF